MLPKAKGTEMDFEALGEQMLARKRELQKHGIPDDAEHKMVASMKGRGDSPAARARRSSSAAPGMRRNSKSTMRAASTGGKRPTKSRRARAAAGRKSARSR